MSLTFIVGKSGTGKTKYCFGQMADTASSYIYMTPEQYTLQAEKELSGYFQKGYFHVQVLSFKRFSQKLLAENGVLRNPFNDTARAMLFQKILQEEKALMYFSAKDQRGLVQELDATVQELMEYSVTPAVLKLVADKLPQDSALSLKLQDLYRIFLAYQEYVRQNKLSSQQDLDAAGQLLSKGGYGNIPVYIDGFDGFTPQQRKWIQKLMQITDVTVTLTMDPAVYEKKTLSESNLFYTSWREKNALVEMAEIGHIPVHPPLPLEKSLRHHQEILKLEPALFGYGNFSLPGAPQVAVKGFENKYKEVEFAAQKIMQLVCEEGMRYQDIGVVAGNVSEYESALKAVGQDYRLPFFLDIKKDFQGHPLIEFIRCLFAIVNHNFAYEAVFGLLKTGFFPITPAERDKLENYVLSTGVKGYMWHEENWEFTYNVDEEALEEINAIKEMVYSYVLPFIENTKGKKTVKALTETLYRFLLANNVDVQYEEKIAELAAMGLLEQAEYYRQVWAGLCDILDASVSVLGEMTVSMKEYAGIMETGFLSKAVGMIPPSADQIQVGDFTRSKMPPCKALFILGVNEGAIPQSKTMAGILLDDEKKEMSRLGLPLSLFGAQKAYQELFQIYAAVFKASHYVIFTYAHKTLDGKSLTPSHFIFRLLPLEKQWSAPLYYSPGGAVHLLALAMNKETLQEPWQTVAAWCDTHQQNKLKLLKRVKKDEGHRAYLTALQASKLYGNRLRTSVSALEQYRRCPFGYFLRYGMRAKERQMFKLSPPDVGTLFHHVLEKFSKHLYVNHVGWAQVEDPLIDSFVEQEIDAVVPQIGGGVLTRTAKSRYTVNRLKRVSKKSLSILAKQIQAGVFEPAHYEVAFGPSKELPAKEIVLKDGKKVILEGRIDRVDILKKDDCEYVRIVDYKSGADKFDIHKVYHGLQLQLLVYMDVYVKEDGRRIPGGLFYFRIQDPVLPYYDGLEIEKDTLKEMKLSGLVLKDVDIALAMDQAIQGNSMIIPVHLKGRAFSARSSVCEEDTFFHLLEYVEKLIAQQSEKILSGQIDILPIKNKEETACQYCPYPSVCRFDPALHSYDLIKTKPAEQIWKEIEGNTEPDV